MTDNGIHLTVVFHPCDDDDLSHGLRQLTRHLMLHGHDGPGGGLGGPWGYGVLYENEVFGMHPYCWCEEEDCSWCNGAAPNFLHKPSGFAVYWYKYIGRGMEANRELDTGQWQAVLSECMASVERSDENADGV